MSFQFVKCLGTALTALRRALQSCRHFYEAVKMSLSLIKIEILEKKKLNALLSFTLNHFIHMREIKTST